MACLKFASTILWPINTFHSLVDYIILKFQQFSSCVLVTTKELKFSSVVFQQSHSWNKTFWQKYEVALFNPLQSLSMPIFTLSLLYLHISFFSIRSRSPRAQAVLRGVVAPNSCQLFTLLPTPHLQWWCFNKVPQLHATQFED